MIRGSQDVGERRVVDLLGGLAGHEHHCLETGEDRRHVAVTQTLDSCDRTLVPAVTGDERLDDARASRRG